MARDLVYYSLMFPTYVNQHKLVELGEIQQNFNMSRVVDGTKDSLKIQVVSYSVGKAIDPFTIIYHLSTNTWWVVSHDNVLRYANESGFMYVHELDLLGASELLNARDLTDCGFRSNKYTIDQATNRLLSLSNFEFSVNYIYNGLNADQKMNYVKTFENYTLLSALRELYNGYNCAVKLSFNTITYNNELYISSANLNVVSKTGLTDTQPININNFTDIRETRTIDKNSFGSQVITNAENVIGGKRKIFPSIGTTKLSSEQRLIVDSNGSTANACIRLPSAAYKVNKLTLVTDGMTLYCSTTNANVIVNIDGTPYDDYALNNAIQKLITDVASNGNFGQDVADYIRERVDTIKKGAKQSSSFEFYDGFLYDAMNDTNSETSSGYNPFKLSPSTPTGVKILKFDNSAYINVSRHIVLTDKDTRDSFALPRMGIYWQRGSNLIKGFDYFGIDYVAQLPYYKTVNKSYSVFGNNNILEFTINNRQYTVYVNQSGNDYYDIDPMKVGWIIDYIPMSDIKIETHNNRTTKDIQIYNQNGKLNDGYGLSKLINSYSNEITDENIVRYKDYYDFDSIPQVGSLVVDSGTYYIINNISYDFYQNESDDNDIGYKIECEFSLSKQVAVKSLMVNANSNIRDYGIPQKDNVARKQVYKDIYSFSQTSDFPSLGDSYVSIDKLLVLQNMPDKGSEDYVAFINCHANYPTYSENSDTPTGTITDTYYQLNTTKFVLSKQIIYKLDFNDNNIIGYDSQNIASGWDVSNVLLKKVQDINTPISYVDSVGEVEGITIQFVNNENTGDVFSTYAADKGLSGIGYLSQRVFLDEQGEIYELARQNATFSIEENGYNKDALEIPVFEYSCQLLSSDDVIACDSIFNTYEEDSYRYRLLFGFAYVNGYATENNALNYATNEIQPYVDGLLIGVKLENTCSFDIQDDRMLITFYERTKLTLGINPYNENQITPNIDKDIAIYRYIYDITTGQTVSKEPILILKAHPTIPLASGKARYFVVRKNK